MDDRALAASAQAGDREAFMRLVRTHQARVRALARGLVGDHGLAEDVAQEAFLQAWRGLPGFRGASSFSTWLYTIARRAALEQVRRRTLQTVPLDQAPALPDPAPADPGLRQDAERAIQALDPDQREAFLLVAVAGLTYEEAGEVLGCPPGTVASRVFRARARLADALRLYKEGPE